MHDSRIRLLAEDLNNHVFDVLNSEPDIEADTAGRVASAVERAMIEAMKHDENPDPGWDGPSDSVEALIWVVLGRPSHDEWLRAKWSHGG
jgi:hypothetical protein